MTIIEPKGDRLLVAENKQETRSPSGIILTNPGADGSSRLATVLAVSSSAKGDFVVGDVVHIDWQKVKTIKVGDSIRGIVNTEDVLAKVIEE